MILVSVMLTVCQDKRRIKIGFESLEAVLDLGALRGEISVAESEHLDFFLRHLLKKGSRAIPRLVLASTIAAENDPSHDETRYLSYKA